MSVKKVITKKTFLVRGCSRAVLNNSPQAPTYMTRGPLWSLANGRTVGFVVLRAVSSSVTHRHFSQLHYAKTNRVAPTGSQATTTKSTLTGLCSESSMSGKCPAQVPGARPPPAATEKTNGIWESVGCHHPKPGSSLFKHRKAILGGRRTPREREEYRSRGSEAKWGSKRTWGDHAWRHVRACTQPHDMWHQQPMVLRRSPTA